MNTLHDGVAWNLQTSSSACNSSRVFSPSSPIPDAAAFFFAAFSSSCQTRHIEISKSLEIDFPSNKKTWQTTVLKATFLHDTQCQTLVWQWQHPLMRGKHVPVRYHFEEVLKIEGVQEVSHNHGSIFFQLLEKSTDLWYS